MSASATLSEFRRSARFGRDFLPRPSGRGGEGAGPSGTWALRFELIRDREDFNALENEWNELHDRAAPFCNPFLSFNWCWHWCNHFLGAESGTELCILTARRFGRLVMIWPTVRQRASGTTSVTWLGAPVSQYGDVLAERGEDTLKMLEAGWAFLLRNVSVDFIALGKVRADGTVSPLLKKLELQITRRDAAPYVDLASAATFDEYAERYSTNSRKKRQRKMRQLSKLGTVHHQFHYDGAGARQLSERIIDLKHRWLAAKGLVSSGLSDPRTRGFFADVAEGRGRPTGCRVMSLMCGDEVAAGEISFACGDTVSGHIVVFNGDYLRQSPGLLLTEDNLRICKDYGYSRYDFMGPCEQHKLDWADGIVEVNDYAVAVSLKGRLWVTGYLSWGRPRLKKLLNSVPPGVRAFVARLHPALSRLA